MPASKSPVQWVVRHGVSQEGRRVEDKFVVLREHGIVDVGAQGYDSHVRILFLRGVLEEREYAVREDEMANMA